MTDTLKFPLAPIRSVLEELLEKHESGELVTIAFVYEDVDGRISPGWAYDESADIPKLIGGSVVLTAWLQQQYARFNGG